MIDPPRLRDLNDNERPFARDLLRRAEPTRAFTPADAARLHGAVLKAGAASTSGWFALGAAPKLLAALAVVATGGLALHASRRVEAPSFHASTPRQHLRPAVAAPNVTTASEGAALPLPAELAPRDEPEVEAIPTPSARPRGLAQRPHHDAGALPVVAAPAAGPSLNQELQVIDEARRAMRTDPAHAVERLGWAEREMPGGQLRDERDALFIEALTHLGRWSEARARASTLEQRVPQSPQAARVRALLVNTP